MTNSPIAGSDAGSAEPYLPRNQSSVAVPLSVKRLPVGAVAPRRKKGEKKQIPRDSLLRAVIEAAVIGAEGNAAVAARYLMLPTRLLVRLARHFELPVELPPPRTTTTKEALQAALAESRGNVSLAAKKLNTTRRTVQRLSLRFGLRQPGARARGQVLPSDIQAGESR